MFYFILLLGFLSQSAHTEKEHNAFVFWAKQYAQEARQEGGWVCGLLPPTPTSGFPWEFSPLQGSDWNRLHWHIPEDHSQSMPIRGANDSDISQWPVNFKPDHSEHKENFSVNANDSNTDKYSESFLSKQRILPLDRDKSYRYKNGYFQIWDEHLWLTPTMGHLSQVAPVCWEQRMPSHSAQPHASKILGWIPAEQCQHTIIFSTNDSFDTDWSSRPSVRWAAPNGTQWLCGTNLWPWLPPSWIGRCTLGLPWVPMRWAKSLNEPANSSVFLQQNSLSSQSAHAVGLRDDSSEVESLAHYLDEALYDTAKEENSFANVEAQLLKKAELQHQMAHDTAIAAIRGRCAIIIGECCVYIPKLSGVEHARPGPASYDGSTWDFLFKIPGWKWLISIMGCLLIIVLFLPCTLKYVLRLMPSNFEAVYFPSRIESRHGPALYFGPPDTDSDLESQEEFGP